MLYARGMLNEQGTLTAKTDSSLPTPLGKGAFKDSSSPEEKTKRLTQKY